MSTRSQLRFVRPDQDDASPDDPTGVAQVYKHSDGYPSAMRELDQPLFRLGNAAEVPATGIHADEEFLYEVDVPPGPSAELADWTVRVSAHCEFPRWDGATATAFDQTTRKFRGPLSRAHVEFVQDDGDGEAL